MKYTLSKTGKIVLGAAVFVIIVGILALNQYALNIRISALEHYPIKLEVAKPTVIPTPTVKEPSFQATGSAIKTGKKS